MTNDSSSASRNIALYLVSSALSILAHNIFVYVMIVQSQTLSGSSAVSGTIYFALFLPIILLTFSAGVWADRHRRRKILLAGLASGGGAMLLAVLASTTGVVAEGRYFGLFVIALLYGSAACIAGPARLSFVGCLARQSTADRILISANILHFACLSAGPAIAGAVLNAFGWPGIHAFSSTLTITSALIMLCVRERFPQAPVPTGGVKDGFRFVLLDKGLLNVFGLLAVIGLFLLGPLQVIVPEYAKSNLHMNEAERGVFMIPFGIGLLTGGGLAKMMATSARRGVLLAGGIVTSAACFAALPLLAPGFLASAALLLVGIGGGVAMALSSASINARASERFRGRVMGLFTWIMTGSAALGALTFGAIARVSDAGTAIVVAGIGAVATTLSIAFRSEELRRLTGEHAVAPTESNVH